MPPRLSVVLITHNEAERLGECLDSVAGLADEIIVLDDGSTDGTQELARARGATVAQRRFDNFGAQKQAALELARGEWVLSLDADERVTPALARDIRAAITVPNPARGYWIRRELIYLGTPLRFGGTRSDWVLRLARREHAHFAPVPIHERLVVDGPTQRLPGTLTHVKYRTLAEHLATINAYTEVIAAGKRDRGGRFHWWHVLRLFVELFKRLVLQLGVLDGRAGIIHATMAAFYAFLKYAKMWRATDA